MSYNYSQEMLFGLFLCVHKFLDHGFLFLGSFEIIEPSNFLLFNGYLSFGTSYFKGYIIRARWRWKQDLCTCRAFKGAHILTINHLPLFYGITHVDFTEQKSTLSCRGFRDGVAIHAYTLTNM
jgi:hypothetical protein